MENLTLPVNIPTTYTTKLGAAASTLQAGDNIIFNDTATREIHMVVNGENATAKSKFRMVGYRCWPTCDGAS